MKRLVLLLLALFPAVSLGQGFSDPGLGLGVQIASSRAPDADAGTLYAGAQARLRLTGGIGLEGSIGLRQERYGPLRVTEVPVQGSFLVFLLTSRPVQPYLLGGGGYYWVRVNGIPPGEDRKTESQFGLHAGGGVDVRVARRLSLFLDARYVSLQVTAVEDAGRKADYWTGGLGASWYF